MNLSKTLAAAAAVLTLGTTAANAATISFTDQNVTAPSITYTADGVSVTATAATWTEDSYDVHSGTGTGTIDLLGDFHDSAVLDTSSFGMALTNAVFLPGLLNIPLDGHQIDGEGNRDLVLFEFDQAVRLTGLAFSFVDEADDFVLFAADSTGAMSVFSLMDVMSGNVALDVVGQSFGIGAFGADDAFKLTAMSFDLAPVPLPAAAPLFAGAMVLGGLARRRARH